MKNNPIRSLTISSGGKTWGSRKEWVDNPDGDADGPKEKSIPTGEGPVTPPLPPPPPVPIPVIEDIGAEGSVKSKAPAPELVFER